MTAPHTGWQDGTHPLDLLVDYVADRLPDDEARAVRRHVDACRTCAGELAAWRAVATAARDHAEGHVPSAALLPAIAERIGAERRERPSVGRRLRWLADLVARQAPLVRGEIWPASTVVVAIGAAVSLIATYRTTPGAALALFAPLAAGIGIALIYGQQNDPSLELALATPTSPRLVVIARLVLVLAWDLVLALAASLLLAIVHGPQVALPLVGLWLGPMLLLGCLSLVLSLLVGTTPAISVAVAIWAVRALELSQGSSPAGLFRDAAPVVDAVWQTSPLTLGLALAALLVGLLIVPRADVLSSPRAA